MIQTQEIEKYTYNNNNMLPYCFYHNGKEYDILAIKANMGVGKSENLKYLIDQYEKVVIVSFRISLNKQFAENFPDFKLYLDIKDDKFNTDIHNKIIVQIDSFNKIRGEIDLLIIDEITYTMTQLVYSEKRDNNFYALKQYFRKKNQDIMKRTKIILLDALLEEDTLNVFNLFKRNLLFIENEYKKHLDKKVLCYGNDYGLFKNNILKDIENGKKIVIATNSKRELNFLESQICEKFGKSKTYSFIDSDNPEYYIEDWEYLDILGYTPTISAGVSYTKKHFDKIYGYFVNGSATAEIAVQQLFRIRNLSDNEINICIDITNGDKYPTNDEELDEYIINRNKILCNSIDFVKIDYIKDEIIKDEYYYWYKSVIRKEYLSNNNYMNRIIELFKTQGITNIKYTGNKNIENDKLARKNKREHIREINDQEYKDIYNSERLTFDEYSSINKKINKNKNEKNSCKRFDFINKTKIKEEDFNHEVYKKFFRNLTKLNNLAYLHYNGKDIIKNLNKRLDYSIKSFNINNNTYKLHESKRFEKMVICFDIIRQYGFDVTKLLEYKDTDLIKINKEKIKKYIIANYKIIDYAFGTTSKDWNDILSKDNWFTLMNRYINTKMNSMFKISLRIKKVNKEEFIYINGLQYWDIVRFDNEELINEIKEKEISLFNKIDELYQGYEINKKQEEYIKEFTDMGMDETDALICTLAKIQGIDYTEFNIKYYEDTPQYF